MHAMLHSIILVQALYKATVLSAKNVFLRKDNEENCCQIFKSPIVTWLCNKNHNIPRCMLRQVRNTLVKQRLLFIRLAVPVMERPVYDGRVGDGVGVHQRGSQEIGQDLERRVLLLRNDLRLWVAVGGRKEMYNRDRTAV